MPESGKNRIMPTALVKFPLSSASMVIFPSAPVCFGPGVDDMDVIHGHADDGINTLGLDGFDIGSKDPAR
jgi:hypothetical protein